MSLYKTFSVSNNARLAFTYASIICLGVVTPPFKTSCVNNDFDSLASLLYLAILYLIDLLGFIS